MRFIPRSLHAVLDYTTALFLVIAPWVLGLSPGRATAIPVVIGVGTLLYSILTHYEGGLIRVIPFRVHLILDVIAALVFMIAPYALRFTENNAAPFVMIGIYELAVALLTDPNVRGPVPHMGS